MVGNGPATADIQAQLAAVLATKGVPLEDTANRANMAIQRLGLDPVYQALRDPNPWRALKSLAEKPGNRFQFILRTELQNFVDARARSKYGTEISVRKKDSKKGRKDPKSHWSLDPRQVEFVPGQFLDEGNDNVE